MSQAKYFPIMENMTVQEVREYLEERQSVILPLGVIEQHGYHLPLSTDALLAREIGKRVGEKTGILVAPVIYTSFSGGQLPGTINVNPNLMGLVVGDVLRSLALQGFRNIFILLCHGGSENLGSLDNSLKLLLRDDPAFDKVMLVLAPGWKFADAFDQGFKGRDWHAGRVETSAVMALAPELVQMDRLQTDEPEVLKSMRDHPDNYQYARKPLDNEFVVPRTAQRPEVKVGVMGAPEEASLELGQQIVEQMVTRLSELFTVAERERSEEYRTVDWTPAPIIL